MSDSNIVIDIFDLLSANEGVPNVTREEQAAVLSKIRDNTVGARGGNLEAPGSYPERRRSPLNAGTTPDGMPMLHKFVKDDSAVVGRKAEQPWNRMAAFMLLAGRTNSEIALAAGVTPMCVSQLRAQRWFQELLSVLANESGQDVTGALMSHVHNAINAIAEIAETSDNPRVRLSANLALLEHAHGKPLQKVISSVSHTTHASPSEEMESIQQQLATLRASSTMSASSL